MSKSIPHSENGKPINQGNPLYTSQVGSFPQLRRISSEAKPTVNPDGTALVKYSTLYTLDTGIIEYWTGSAWAVMA